ncbi:MAG: lysophospholipid acyltransferase family protein [Flavobacteriaceae bacterium]
MKLLTFLVAYPLLMAVSLLPYPILYALSDFLSFLLYRVVQFRLKVVRKNLALSFPNLSPKERKVIEKEFYRNLCDVFMEMAKNLTISEKNIKKRFVFENMELINAHEEKGESTVLVLGHYSNWEGMLSIGYHLMGKGYGVYKPLTNKYFNRLISKSREKHKAYLISRYETIDFIRSSQEKGDYGLYGFIYDQTPHPKPKTYWRPFMGTVVPVFTGAERLAKEFNFPVYYTEINRVKRGYYTATVSLLVKDPSGCKENEITDLFYDKLEAQIKRDPAQYLWSHNRFKHMHLAPSTAQQ